MSELVMNAWQQHGSKVKKLYTGFVVVAAAVGAYKGLGKYWNWRNKRKYREIKYKTVEPIVNVVCDVGNLALQVGGASVASGAVAAIFPVSVPVLLYLCEENPEPPKYNA